GGKDAAIGVVQEAVLADGVEVIPDDLARGVDAVCHGVASGQGIVESDVSAAAFEEAVESERGVLVKAHDLAGVVDAKRLGVAAGGQRIVEGGVGIDWHDTGSSLIVSLAKKVDREAEPLLTSRSA